MGKGEGNEKEKRQVGEGQFQVSETNPHGSIDSETSAQDQGGG